METCFVDSNIFYYHLLQDKVYGASATEVIRRIRDGEEAATSVIVLSELMSLFEYRMIQTARRKDLSEGEKAYITERFKKSMSGLSDLIMTLTHLEKLDCVWEDALKAFKYGAEYGLGFNDAAILAAMERKNISNVYSFDKAFVSVLWVRRRDS